jgi:hypothetical protein
LNGESADFDTLLARWREGGALTAEEVDQAFGDTRSPAPGRTFDW